MPTYAATVIADAPVSYWRLGEPSGTAAVDQMGVQNGVYNLSGVTLGVAGPLIGDPGTAAAFDGANSYVSLATNAAHNLLGPLSIEIWLNATYAGPNGSYLYHSRGMAHALAVAGVIGQICYQDSTGVGSGAGVIINDGAWHHAVAVAAGTTVTHYLDGTINYQLPIVAPATTSSGQRAIGSDHNLANQFIGSLAEVAIYSYGLNAAQVQMHYRIGKQIPLGNITTPSGRGGH